MGDLWTWKPDALEPPELKALAKSKYWPANYTLAPVPVDSLCLQAEL